MSRRALISLFSLLASLPVGGQSGGELHFSLRVEPKTFNPLLAAEEGADTYRYLTGGVLIRLNRLTQELEPDLATSWKVSEASRRIDFELRSGVLFSDGTPFSCDDVAYTIQQLMDPNLHSPTGDSFRTGPGKVETKCASPTSGMARFSAPVAALAQQFDQVAILSAKSQKKESAVLGPFQLAEYKPGVSLLLRRNPNYWKRDGEGRKLPYLDSVRLDMQQNRDTEVLRFRRDQIDLVSKLDPELFDQLHTEMPKAVVDIGPSLDWELIVFNQVPEAPIEPYKRAWFSSVEFRRAISEAINRGDIARIVFHGHARPAATCVSPSNLFWYNKSIIPPTYSAQGALKRLEKAGFHSTGGTLYDSQNHKVEFSMITNAGSKVHERTMAVIQQDLAKIGIRLNLVTLDFPSFGERLMRSFSYETALANMTNIGLDPNEVMNIWLSSGANHPWHPKEKTPATPWEAEIDQLMLAQNRAVEPAKRKASFDRVQEIISQQAPILFLVHPNSLGAISSRLRNTKPALLTPQLYWNIERISIAAK